MIKVTNLTWLSQQAKEAELIISDGVYDCIVFAHPCKVNKGDLIKEPLHAFMVEDLMFSHEESYFISKIRAGGLSQKCVAKVINKLHGLVQIGEINILLDEKLPVGIEENNFVEFICVRVDLW